MLPSRKAQFYLSLVCFLATVGIYTFFHASTNFESFLPPAYQDATQPSTTDRSQVAQPLHPELHVFRAPKQISLSLNITAGVRQPDGVTKDVYLINGQFPGPLIEARSGDTLIVKVLNLLRDNEGVAIHFHGLSMRGANSMDGTVGVTQRAILPSKSFVYKFKIEDDQAGTFWYHAHSEVQRADGLYGGLIVHRPAQAGEIEKTSNDYDEELMLLIGDWYHRPAGKILDYYLDWRNFGQEPSPDSLLINGLGSFNCSMAVPARPLQCRYVTSPRLNISGKRSRLRIVNTGALTGLSLSMTGYEMVLYQIDGGNPVEATAATQSMGILYPGERIDILIRRIVSKAEPTITIALDPENMRFPNLALTPVQTFKIEFSRGRQYSPSDDLVTHYDLTKVLGFKTSDKGPPHLRKAPQTLVLYTKIEILSHYRNIPKGFINRTSWSTDKTDSNPLVSANRAAWEEHFFVPRLAIGESEWVDVVLNNLDDKSHPFHLHGHDFLVLSIHESPRGSYEAYNPFDSTKEPAGGPMNFHNPPNKDTVVVPRMGYVVLRFLANNPGIWFFHCHVLWHEAVGMAMAFQVGDYIPNV